MPRLRAYKISDKRYIVNPLGRLQPADQEPAHSPSRPHSPNKPLPIETQSPQFFSPARTFSLPHLAVHKICDRLYSAEQSYG